MTDFITPESKISRNFRNAVLNLARGLVNSGRLSLPARYADSPLNHAGRTGLRRCHAAVSVAADAPVAGDQGQQW